MTKQLDSLDIVEGDDYQVSLVNKDGERTRLYKVRLLIEVFVLAKDKEGAISQAKCILGNEVEVGDREISADSIPFGIRGWGRHIF